MVLVLVLVRNSMNFVIQAAVFFGLPNNKIVLQKRQLVVIDNIIDMFQMRNYCISQIEDSHDEARLKKKRLCFKVSFDAIGIQSNAHLRNCLARWVSYYKGYIKK